MSSFPTCTVCHQQFSLKGPAPFLLPCLHAVCETCVTYAAVGVISCSPCQRDFNLTETSLEKDGVREQEILHLTVKHHPELVLCTHGEDGNQAVCWCKECEDFFCENCQMVHNSFKGTRRHTVHKLGELEVDAFDEEKYCTVHPKLIADEMDEDCKMLTCLKCRREDHAGHRAGFVEEIADLARKKLTKLQTDLKCTIDKRRVHLAAAEKSLSSLEQTYTMLPDQITHTFLSLRNLIDQREKELQIELQKLKEKSGKERERKNRSETCLKRCLIVSDYISKTLQYSTMQDLLELGILDEENPLNYDSSASSGDSRPCPLPVFNTQGLEMIKTTLAQFGTIETENEVVNHRTEDAIANVPHRTSAMSRVQGGIDDDQSEETSRPQASWESAYCQTSERETEQNLTPEMLEMLAKELLREKENAEDAFANLLKKTSAMSRVLTEIDDDQSEETFGPQASWEAAYSQRSESPLQGPDIDMELLEQILLEVEGKREDEIFEDASLIGQPMEASFIRRDKLNFPRCCFCQFEFRICNPAPFLLLCGHDLCEKCLNSLGPKHSRPKITCPLCNTLQNTSNLHKNIRRQREVLDLTVKWMRSRLICKHIHGDEMAVCWCPDCKKLLCKKCQRIHENAVPHQVFNIPKLPVQG